MIGPLEKCNNDLSNEKADKELVEHTVCLMESKLSKKREEGYGGWHKFDECNNKYLLEKLNKNFKQGDLLDVINLASMILCRTSMYGDKA